eukprot:Pgem_evm1s13165
MADTETVIQEVSETSSIYEPLANACSSIFFMLEQLNQLNFLYQYSLNFFLNIFLYVLKTNPLLEGIKDPLERLKILKASLFGCVFGVLLF